MNDAPTTASDQHPEEHGVTSNSNATATVTASGDARPAEHEMRAQRNHKLSFLDNLIRNIDIMIYCELSILYYMDCSLLKFIIRALPHWFYFTPKPDVFPPAPLLQRPYIGTIFISNLFCILLHMLLSLPSAGESSHGFLHGGLLIDFVGQQSPVLRIRLVALDLLTLTLQLVMLAVTVEKQKMQGKPLDGNSVNPTTSIGERTPQDHDAEEQGILRSEAHFGEDMELQNLSPSSQGRTGENEDRRRDGSFDRDGSNEAHDAHPIDAFHTGDYMVADLHIIDTIRTQWKTKGPTVDAASTSSGMQTAATLAGRRITFDFGNRTLMAP